jgi:hypothetical protein
MNPSARPPYPRILAPVVERPTTRRAQGIPGTRSTGATGGLRTYSDEPLVVGAILEIDILLEADATVSAVAEVEWCDRVPFGSPARFDIGLGIHRLAVADRLHLEAVLAPHGHETPAASSPGPARAEKAPSPSEDQYLIAVHAARFAC